MRGVSRAKIEDVLDCAFKGEVSCINKSYHEWGDDEVLRRYSQSLRSGAFDRRVSGIITTFKPSVWNFTCDQCLETRPQTSLLSEIEREVALFETP